MSFQYRASDLALSTYLLGAYATNLDLTLSFVGEFSPNGRTGTIPFAPPILHYPNPYSAQMLDLLLSDYTINTLLYHLHRRGLFTFRIGSELPGVGDLLNTTCAGDDFYLDVSNEIQEMKDFGKHTDFYKRWKREDGVESLRNFGVCFGDIAPEIREKNPDKRVYIIVKTVRAPSVQFKAADRGTVIVELMADGLIYLDGTSKRVGRVRVVTAFAVIPRLLNNQIIGTARIEYLKFVDIDKTFGLQQEAFDNLADLARGTINRVVNSKLAQGTPLSAPKLTIPIDLYNINIKVTERALLLSTDINVQPSMLRLPN
ncbi:unnamed protein product [Gongylonema pulchrum]|uniref:BPI2 domain-containing protein n=1 Tax=Gongylonema pulchrum TaxID=637853 RepID=A0A183CV74_9BILA|nr:unnamed protein product [Gongylonema pulchrum]